MPRIYIDKTSQQERLVRLLWVMISFFLSFFPTIPLFNALRINILRIFGAKIGAGCKIYPTCKIFKPWKLKVQDYSCLGPNSLIYNIDFVHIGSNVTVSQGAFLCTGSHDITEITKPLISSPIILENNTWICAEAFVGPNVVVKEGSVIGARCVIMSATDPWSVYVGNPAVKVKERILKSTSAARKTEDS